MTDAEIDALARDILTGTIDEVRSWEPQYFHEIHQMKDGELIPVYAATSPDGYGSFRCEYMPLETIKTLIRECEKAYDDFEHSISEQPLFASVKGKLEKL